MASGLPLEDALAHLNAGRPGDAAAACEAVLRGQGEDAAALHLLGVALARMGREREALPPLRRAVHLAPSSAPVRYHLGQVLRALGDLGAAAREFGAASLADPVHFEAMKSFVDVVAAVPPETRPGPPRTGSIDRLGQVTVGLCTVQPARARRACESLERALAPARVAFDVVDDARSLAEAFNRILDRARGDVVILCHDDIEVLGETFHEGLADALAGADLVGVAGAQRVAGPAVLWAGHPHLHGAISYPRTADGFEAALLSLRRGVVAGMQSLDGVFIALGPRARELRFDATTFDGFHFYDLDFTWRAALAGLRLAVSTDIRLLHQSEGDFGDTWQRHAERFVAKYPRFAGTPPGPHHWYSARFTGRDALLAFHDRLDREVAALATPP